MFGMSWFTLSRVYFEDSKVLQKECWFTAWFSHVDCASRYTSCAFYFLRYGKKHVCSDKLSLYKRKYVESHEELGDFYDFESMIVSSVLKSEGMIS